MRYAIFSDVHGNLLNLASFFHETKDLGIDNYICLGDLCNYYPDNRGVIDLISEKDIVCLMGNHDEIYVRKLKLDKRRKRAYNFDSTLIDSSKHIDFLSSCPVKYELDYPSKALFCHASPNGFLHDYIYPNTDLSHFSHLEYEFVFIGHTHRQFVRRTERTTFCNVGSIGLPRDNGELMGYAIFDNDKKTVDLHRIKINVEKVLEYYAESTPDEVLNLMNRKEDLLYNYKIKE
ncbi:metallophosphoesterase family protein [uncultured Roseivirga sp.]|uniref:metallophosphoesterase family protein n=1 Tax=uncultured Roseivirga sp. TaxID=543088 RepID=UPI0030DB4EC9|tara:strand:- start:4311 stop:5009 length:699 start_codon:yes stop_codon:yes gene_type:complete